MGGTKALNEIRLPTAGKPWAERGISSIHLRPAGTSSEGGQKTSSKVSSTSAPSPLPTAGRRRRTEKQNFPLCE